MEVRVKMTIAALTTVDNPYDPFEDFTHWHLFDIEKGYRCCEITARLARVTDLMSEVEAQNEIERAIDDFVLRDPTNVYTKVTQEVPLEDFLATKE